MRKCWEWSTLMLIVTTLADVVYWVNWSASSSLCTWVSWNLLWRCTISFQPNLSAQHHKCMVHSGCSGSNCWTTIHPHSMLHSCQTVDHGHDPTLRIAFHLDQLLHENYSQLSRNIHWCAVCSWHSSPPHESSCTSRTSSLRHSHTCQCVARPSPWRQWGSVSSPDPANAHVWDHQSHQRSYPSSCWSWPIHPCVVGRQSIHRPAGHTTRRMPSHSRGLWCTHRTVCILCCRCPGSWWEWCRSLCKDLGEEMGTVKFIFNRVWLATSLNWLNGTCPLLSRDDYAMANSCICRHSESDLSSPLQT